MAQLVPLMQLFDSGFNDFEKIFWPVDSGNVEFIFQTILCAVMEHVAPAIFGYAKMTVTYEVAMKTGNISIYYTYAWWSYCLWRWVKKWGTTWIFRFGVILLNSQQSEVKGFPKRSAGITLRVYMTKKKSIWNIILAIRNRKENGIIKLNQEENQKKEWKSLSWIYVVFSLHVWGFSADVGQSKKFQHMQMVIYTYFLEPWFIQIKSIYFQT